MLQDILRFVPNIHPGLAMGIAAAGLLLAIVGARLSKSILALVLVAAGTLIGLRVPRWFGWGIDPMGTAFGAAILLGLSGYILSTIWEGVFFGALLSMIAGVAVWMALVAGTRVERLTVDWSASLDKIATAIWGWLPATVKIPLPAGIAIGFAIGVVMVTLWPRLGRVLLYTIFGLLLFVIAGGVGVRQQHPEWLEHLTMGWRGQIGCFAGAVILAAVIQWLLIGRDPDVGGGKSDKRESDEEQIQQIAAAERPARSHAQPQTNAPQQSRRIEPPPTHPKSPPPVVSEADSGGLDWPPMVKSSQIPKPSK